MSVEGRARLLPCPGCLQLDGAGGHAFGGGLEVVLVEGGPGGVDERLGGGDALPEREVERARPDRATDGLLRVARGQVRHRSRVLVPRLVLRQPGLLAHGHGAQVVLHGANGVAGPQVKRAHVAELARLGGGVAEVVVDGRRARVRLQGTGRLPRRLVSCPQP